MKRFRFEVKGPLLLAPVFALFLSCAAGAAGEKPPVVYRLSTEEAPGESREELRLENEFLELRFLPETAEIILTERESGTVWRSSPENGAVDPAADGVTKKLLGSQFSLVYGDNTGMSVTLSSAEYSVEKGNYEYAAAAGGIEVNYTVGDILKVYYFPAALPAERMLLFMEKMDGSARARVESFYRLYDIDNLRATDNKNALLESYPDLKESPVYALRDNTPEYLKEQLEELFTAAGYTREDFAVDSARYRLEESEKPLFNVTVRYELEDNSLLVTVPFDKIRWRAAFPPTRLNLLPFFGAGGKTDEGYLFVPDGSGALINFNNGKEDQIAYNSNVYGWDEGVWREAIINDNKAPYPVFGVRKNGRALLCVIEEGASYAAVRADVSGRNCSWNSVSAQFAIIHGAAMDISGKSDMPAYLYERALPEGEQIRQRFIPCGEATYVGMAKEYRSYLLKKYPSGFQSAGEGVPVAVEILGAVNKTQHRLGIPFDLPLKLTSYKETENMIRDFASFGWENTHIKMTGWFNGSIEHAVPSKTALIRELGGRGDFMRAAASAGEYGYTFYAEGDFFYMRDNTPFDGFDLNRDAARYVSRERVESYPYSSIWFGEQSRFGGKLRYLARPAYTTALIGNYMEAIQALGVSAAAFRNIGANLAGDYDERRPVSREASMNMQQALLADLKGQGKKLWVNAGYAYAAPYADFITDLALSDQGFGITDVPVPFYEIVLHGLVPYAGRAINLAEDYTKNLLETIERGGALYFSFMTEETAALQETKFLRYYANEYAQWVPDAAALYQRFAADFSGLFSRTIENHGTLAPGVTLTEYQGGTGVIVNQSGSAYLWNGTVVEADNYAVINGGAR